MNRIMRAALVAMAVAASVFAAGCSDGDPWSGMQQSFDVTPAPMIIKFYAEPSAVKAGEGTTIFWEVADANAISIAAVSSTGESIPFSVQTAELSGSAAVPALAASADFVITATKKMAPAEGEEAGDAESETAGDVTASQTITVTVEAAMAIEATISADKDSVLPGEPVVITWGVTPAEGVTVAVSADSGEALVASDACAADAAAAAGCGVAYPEKTTVYTVTATDANDPENVVTQSVEVEVDDAEVEADIKVNGESEAKITSIENEVVVTWTVTPATAKVTVTASPAVVSCAPELPSGQTSEVTSATCKLSAIPTTFTVSAVVGDMPAVEDSAEVRQGSVDAGIDVRADEWAFEGETVPVLIDLKDGIDATMIKEVQFTDKVEGIKKVTQFPLDGPVMVVAPKDGIRVKMVDAGGAEHDYGTRVRTLSTIADSVAEDVIITKLALDPNDPTKRFTGVQMPNYNDGKVRLYINGSTARDIDFASALKAKLLGDPKSPLWQKDAFEKHVKTFPVNAITVRPGDSNKIYVGTTGGLFASADGGSSFALVAPAMFLSKTGSDYAGSHASCRGKTQTGVKASHKGQLVALSQVCDVAVGKGGRAIIATDMGAYGISNIDAFGTDKNVKVVGNSSALMMHVVDDIECLDGECMTALAATDMGVFRTEDGGETWSEFGALGARSFAVVALGDQVFAGTENGVAVTGLAQASWQPLGIAGFKVFALAIDPNVGLNGMMIIAGTDRGVQVTRDSGKSWSAIDAGGQEESLSVAISSAEGSAGKKAIGVTIGSGKRAVHGETEVTKVQ